LKNAEKKHKEAVESLGCALCHHLYGDHDPGPVELHHLREGGWGRGSYLTLMGLCYEHHRGNKGIHGLGTRGFVEYYGITQQELLEWTLNKIGQT
jgi:hypothetical protein